MSSNKELKVHSNRETFSPRVVADLRPVCPAAAPIGETIAGAGVRCRIEHSTIPSAGMGMTLRNFCCSQNYQKCGTWHLHREAEMAKKDGKMRDMLKRQAGSAA